MAKGDAYYLKHDNDAFSDQKIINLRMLHGFESYGLYWRILELLFDEPDNRLEHGSLTFKTIEFDTRTNLEVEEVINTMVEIGLLDIDEDTNEFFSQSLDRRIATMKGISEARAEAGRKSGLARKEKARRKALAEQEGTNVEQVLNNPETKTNNEMRREEIRRDEKKGDEKNSRDEPDRIHEEVVIYLNDKTGSRYRPTTDSTKRLIKARQNEGFTLENFKTVIDKKTAEWKGGEMEKYLRPETLFGTKFEGYLNQTVGANPKMGSGGYKPRALPEEYADNPDDFANWFEGDGT